jgi:hypothetical protein
MFLQLLKRSSLAALILTALALPSQAAPVIKSGGPTLKLDKFLLDDVDGVLVVDIKQVMASPAYKKNFQKLLADLVAHPMAQEYLKDIGFDPLKDVERFIICMSKSCLNSGPRKGENDEGPYLLFQGKIDAVRAKAKMAELAKKHPDVLAVTELPGGQTLYRLDPRHGPYLAQLDANTIVMCFRKAHALAALEKASGKKTTKFANAEVPNLLRKFKPDVAIQGFALEQMVMSASGSAKTDGMGNTVFETNYITLADKGFKEAFLSVNVKDDARGSIVWTVKDKDKLKASADWFKQGLDMIIAEGKRAAERQPQVQPMIRFLEGVTVKSSGQTITLEAKADVEMVQALIASMGIR